jgi:hypothetical protein
MKKIIALSFLLISIFSYSQITTYEAGQALDNQWFKNIFKLEEKDISGSPYYNSKFIPTTIKNLDEIIDARYNIYNDNIEFLKEGKIMVVPKSDIYSEFSFETGEKVELIDGGYYYVVNSGKNAKLYKKIKIKFQDFKRSENGYAEDRPAKFILLDGDYFLMVNNKLQEFPKNQKDFASLFPVKKEDVLKFLKQNNNKLKSESDLKSAMIFVNK